jgi:hypothetical protein
MQATLHLGTRDLLEAQRNPVLVNVKPPLNTFRFVSGQIELAPVVEDKR